MAKSRRRLDIAWQKQVRKCRQFIKNLEETPTMHGQKWKDSMLKHYRGKLKELLADRPKPF